MKGLAFGRRRRRRREVDPVGRQTLGRDLERRARARRRFEKQVDDGLAAQGRHLLDGPIGDLQEALAEVEDRRDFLGERCSMPSRCFWETRGDASCRVPFAQHGAIGFAVLAESDAAPIAPRVVCRRTPT